MKTKQAVIWKYDVPIEDEFVLEMPDGPTLLAFQMQAGQPTLWAAVDPNAPKRNYMFRLFGTGHTHAATDFWPYVGTVQMNRFVWHLFAGGVAPEGA